jgi:magnesium transporter
MMDAYASIISNNLNVVMKFLASATIVLSFPTIVASIYGMNVALPGAKSPEAFFVVMGAALTLSLLVAVVFSASQVALSSYDRAYSSAGRK